MLIRDKEGKMRIEKKDFYGEEEKNLFNEKYGFGRWYYIDAVCTGLSPTCVHQLPNGVNCPYKDGTCIRYVTI